MTQPAAPKRREPGLRVGSVAGVPVRLMPSWFLFAAYLVLSGEAVLRDELGRGRAVTVAASFAVLLLVSVVLHEAGHCLVARAFGLPVRRITVTLLAGLTEITKPPQTPAREYAVAVAGPMVSLLLCGAGVAAAEALPDDSLPQLVLSGAAVANGALAVLNLLPGLPLDGGRVLRSVVWRLVGDAEQATRVAAYAGMVLALVVIPGLVLGVLPALGFGERSLVSAVLAALIGMFVYTGAVASLRRSQVVSRLPALSVARLARPALAVPASMPLAEAVRRAQERAVRALVVVDGAGRLEGLVSEAWVRQVPEDRRPWVTVGEGARRVEPGLWVADDLTGEALLEALQRTPASEYAVQGPSPRVLVSADVAEALGA
jgi:Zn-dependent protease